MGGLGPGQRALAVSRPRRRPGRPRPAAGGAGEPGGALARQGRDKPASDGISIDRDGNVYVTDVLRGAIGVSTAGGYRVLARDPRMIWPDGTAFGGDGWLYASISQFGRMPLVNGGQDRGEPPYLVLRLKPLAPSTIGR